MPCISMRPKGMTEAQRQAQIDRALRRLRERLASSEVTLTVGPTGAIAFVGWTDRDDVSDVCAFRTLTAEGSPELRLAKMRAEARCGRQVDERAVAAGTHSHDGGRTWHPGH